MATIKAFFRGQKAKVKSHAKGMPPTDFDTAKLDELFPATRPEVDGDDCLHDCESCTVSYPRKFDIETSDKLYGYIDGWSTHAVVATGKTDWVRDVADETGSVMEAIGKVAPNPSNGKLKLSASNMPVPDLTQEAATSVLLLPAWAMIDNVRPANVPLLITDVINHAPTNTDTLPTYSSTTSSPTASSAAPTTVPAPLPPPADSWTASNGTVLPPQAVFKIRACPHKYIIMLCSQRTRDARCGQSAPLLRKEFERHLRPTGLFRDMQDERPDGVGIYFISHVGGHKYSANVLIYRRADAVVSSDAEPLEKQNGHVNGQTNGHVNGQVNGTSASGPYGQQLAQLPGAAQCIWLARVRPEDCENIIRYTVLQGKVVKPETQLRGGFDRARGMTSW